MNKTAAREATRDVLTIIGYLLAVCGGGGAVMAVGVAIDSTIGTVGTITYGAVLVLGLMWFMFYWARS